MLFKFRFGMSFRKGGGDPAGVLQDLPVPQGEKTVQSLFPIFHGHGNMPGGLDFRHVKIRGDDPMHLSKLMIRQIILGYDDIVCVDFPVWRAFPGSKPHMILGRIGSLYNDFGCGLTVYRIMQLVLNR